MYKLTRYIHLILGLVVIPFLLVYAISSVFYSHRFLDFSSTVTEVEEFKLQTFPKNPNELVDVLMATHGIRGTLINNSINDSGLMRLVISRPGTVYNIVVDTKTGHVVSEQNTKDAVGFIEALHQAGFRNKHAVESWWSFAIAIVSGILIVIVITGLILWAYRTKDRKSGGLFLFMNIMYCTVVLFVLRLG